MGEGLLDGEALLRILLKELRKEGGRGEGGRVREGRLQGRKG